MKYNIPDSVTHVLSVIHNSGFEAYLVGGCVRDMLIGREPKDFDIATNALPEQVMALGDAGGCKAIPTGIKYGTVTLIRDSNHIEVTTYRNDSTYSDGRRPDAVSYSETVHADLARRDFTMNAIAYNPTTGEFIDPFDGRRDITNRLVRAVGNPDQRFIEDALRMMRAIRQACQLDFSIQDDTADAIVRNSDKIVNVSYERVRDELNKILLCKKPSIGLNNLLCSDLLRKIIPELSQCVGFDQKNPHHRKDVFRHILDVTDFIQPVLHLRLAAMLHDVAKPKCFALDDSGVGHFYGHEVVGAVMAQTILERLKYDRATINNVMFLIAEHMFPPSIGRKGMRRLVVHLGDSLDDLLSLRIADTSGGKTPGKLDYIDEIREVAKFMSEAGVSKSISALAVNGEDIMTTLNIMPGKTVGAILKHLQEIVIDSPELNDKQTLVSIAKAQFLRTG